MTPKKNVRVRRRRHDGATWLILNQYLHELDEITDAIWLAVDGERSTDEIAEFLHRERGWTLTALRNATAATVAAFIAQELLLPDDDRPVSHPAERSP